MATTTVQAEVRKERGKGPARRLRNEGKIPAVLYGQGIEPTPLTVSPKDIKKALTGEKGRNVLLDVQFGGRSEHAMVREVAVDPVSREPIHVDFYRVSLDQPVEAVVPFATKGRAVGVQKGGKLGVTYRTLPVRCTPERIPTKIEVDVSALDLGGHIAVQDLQLPEGVVVTMRPQQTLAHVFEERAPKPEEGAAPAAAAAPAKK